MVRNSSIALCCAALFAIPAKGAAQSFEDMVQAELDAQRVGSSLSDSRGFRMDEPVGKRGAFDRPPPDVHLETRADPEIEWFKPSIEIAGARVSPDLKKKGLKLAIPMELIQSGEALVADRNPNAD